jgi:pilus assembly protein CpaB
MTVRQILVLGLALVCAVAALVVVRGMTNAPRRPSQSEIVALTGPRVLVAARDVPAGAALRVEDLEWRVWAESAVGKSFLTDKASPTALEDLTGGVARQTLVAGEPIVSDRVVKPGDRGFMAAMLAPGFRAVAVPVSEETAASGFILPEDRVDVILTRKVSMIDITGQENQEVRSGVVLQDVRVLAIDQTYVRKEGEEGPEAVKGSVALLELTPKDSEALALADELGDLSLALRPVQNVARNFGTSQVQSAALQQVQQTSREQVRIHAFGDMKTIETQNVGAQR